MATDTDETVANAVETTEADESLDLLERIVELYDVSCYDIEATPHGIAWDSLMGEVTTWLKEVRP